MNATKPVKRKRAVRETLESFGIAILMAVLLKPTVIEAYMIPTSSMQPTMMGGGGVHDRILVDKLHFLLFEPERFDIAVFRYPIRQNQNYVKRIVGIPGDRLRIAGGNLYQVGPDGRVASVVRKPASLQDGMWKEIYPARRYLADGATPAILGQFWSTSGAWQEDGDALVLTGQRGLTSRLSYVDDARYGGIVNRYMDGYPTSVARALISEGGARDLDGVQDVRIAATLTPTERFDSLALEVQVSSAGATKIFSLELQKDGKARLRATVQGREIAATQPFDLPIDPGTATRVALAHVDDELIAWRDGREVARLECDADALRTLARLTRGTAGEKTTGSVAATIMVGGGGRVRVDDLTLHRDHHYVEADDGPFAGPDHVIEVPAGHYFMLGDNPLQSADGRAWTAMTVGVTADGRMVDPKDPSAVRTLVGNSRARDPDGPVDADENPVVLRGRDRVVFTDLPGENHVLSATISPAYRGEGSILFGQVGKEWSPPRAPQVFVPREHVLGRALMGFWPFPPFGPNRFGFIR